MSTHTLVLTPGYQIHSVITWQDAITAQYLGKVQVLETYAETVSSPSITLQIPAVVRLTRHLSGNKRGIKFSRINVFTRDNFECSYCGSKKAMKELNYDHVIPRVQGGKTDWSNIAASCLPCNSKKDGRTPEQAGMKLRKIPYKPKTLPMTPPIVNMQTVPEEWKFYIPEGMGIILRSA